MSCGCGERCELQKDGLFKKKNEKKSEDTDKV